MLLVALVTAAMAGLGVIALPGTPARAAASSSPTYYVSLGDSYAAGY
jgi:hypothetical protein